MSDIDTITKALAAGQQAVVALKARYRDGPSYDQAQRMHLAIYDGMDALKRLAAQLEQPAAFEFGTGLPHHDNGRAPHYIPLEGWDKAPPAPAAPSPTEPAPSGEMKW